MSRSVARVAGLASAGLVLAGLVLVNLVVAGDAHAEVPTETPAVTLLSSGRGSKTKLRFTPQKGTKQSLKMVSGQELTMSVAGNTMPQQRLPDIVTIMDLEISSVDQQRRFVQAFELTSTEALAAPGIPEPLVTQMNESLRGFNALRGTLTISSLGRLIKTDLTMPNVDAALRGALDNLRQNMHRLVVPLPEEAVGIGARWRVKVNLSTMGMPIAQETTYTLVGRRGDKLNLKTQVAQTIGAGPVQFPNLPPGFAVRTKPSSSTGAGEVTVDLNRAVMTGTVDANINVAMEMENAGQTQPMTMAIQMKLTVSESAPAAAAR